jgi:hypothetical protein
MRIVIILALVSLLFAAAATGQSDEADPYSISFVQTTLKLHAQGARISVDEKNIPRLGDRVSIALIKIFTGPELSKPETIRAFLPLIQQSFSEPQFILRDVDKKPQVTLLLLNYLQQNAADTQTHQDIEKTIRFIGDKTPN